LITIIMYMCAYMIFLPFLTILYKLVIVFYVNAKLKVNDAFIQGQIYWVGIDRLEPTL
jgi:hypothetical protein